MKLFFFVNTMLLKSVKFVLLLSLKLAINKINCELIRTAKNEES